MHAGMTGSWGGGACDPASRIRMTRHDGRLPRLTVFSGAVVTADEHSAKPSRCSPLRATCRQALRHGRGQWSPTSSPRPQAQRSPHPEGQFQGGRFGRHVAGQRVGTAQLHGHIPRPSRRQPLSSTPTRRGAAASRPWARRASRRRTPAAPCKSSATARSSGHPANALGS